MVTSHRRRQSADGLRARRARCARRATIAFCRNARHFRRPRDVGDWAVIGAFSGVHQFCRIGRHAIIGGYSVITQDVLPFSTTVSEREIEGLRRERDRSGAARLPDRRDRRAAQSFRLLTRVGTEHHAGGRTHPRGSRRLAGGRRTAGLHRALRARIREVAACATE